MKVQQQQQKYKINTKIFRSKQDKQGGKGEMLLKFII